MTPLIRRSQFAVPRHAGEDGGQLRPWVPPDGSIWPCLSEHIPSCRNGEPEEFGWAAAFALSPASHITGAMIPVDGGASNSY
jgi:NAD(P)-dependent dehydrogenase (short-subunit alcohol dehydrogenase family)